MIPFIELIDYLSIGNFVIYQKLPKYIWYFRCSMMKWMFNWIRNPIGNRSNKIMVTVLNFVGQSFNLIFNLFEVMKLLVGFNLFEVIWDCLLFSSLLALRFTCHKKFDSNRHQLYYFESRQQSHFLGWWWMNSVTAIDWLKMKQQVQVLQAAVNIFGRLKNTHSQDEEYQPKQKHILLQNVVPESSTSNTILHIQLQTNKFP